MIVAAVLARLAAGVLLAGLVAGFLRSGGVRSLAGLALAFLVHGAALLWSPPRQSPPRPRPRFELELVPTLPEPPAVPEPPAPSPEPSAELPEPEKQPNRTRRRRQVRRSKARARAATKPETSAPAAPRRFDVGHRRAASNAGIAVVSGPTAGSSEAGAGSASAADAPSVEPGGRSPKTRSWSPADALHVNALPRPVRVPKRSCTATRHGVQGTVVLDVQVRRDGSVRRARVHEGIGEPCDGVAVAALKSARFKPALDHRRRSVDFELRYEYVFRLTR